VIVCLRTVVVPLDVRSRYLAWIAEGRAVRQAHGILAEWVLDPADGDGDTVLVTVWPSHEVFDAWIATPERDALTASAVHQVVTYRPIVRYDLAGGYTNLPRQQRRTAHEVGYPRPRARSRPASSCSSVPSRCEPAWLPSSRPLLSRLLRALAEASSGRRCTET